MGEHYRLRSERQPPVRSTVTERVPPSEMTTPRSRRLALMPMHVFRRLAWVVAIEGVVLGAAVLYVRSEPDPEATRFLPFAVLAAGGLMSWRFRRSRQLGAEFRKGRN